MVSRIVLRAVVLVLDLPLPVLVLVLRAKVLALVLVLPLPVFVLRAKVLALDLVLLLLVLVLLLRAKVLALVLVLVLVLRAKVLALVLDMPPPVSVLVLKAKILALVLVLPLLVLTTSLEMCTYLVGDMSIGRREAYELFRRDYQQNDSIESNKQRLKQLCVEAKQLGEQLATSRNKISMFTLLSFYFLFTRKSS